MVRVRTAILISGTGSNMEALIRAAQSPDYPAEICLVISNKPDAKGLVTATKLGIPALCIDHNPYADRESFERDIHAVLIDHDIELVALAGFMRVLTTDFVAAWAGRMINIHPSLLPKYKGLHTHQRALDAGDTEHGATVHWVVPELDSGTIIAQRAFPIHANDTQASLRDRLRPIEHGLYIDALASAARHVAASLRPGNPDS